MPAPPISKDPARLAATPPNLADYAAACSEFSWERVADELGAPLAGPLNLGGRAVERAPGGRPALHWIGAHGEEDTLTYGHLRAQSAKFAGALKNLGIQRGDRVIFAMQARPELVAGLLGALRYGAVASVLNPGLNSDAVKNILLRTSAKALFLESDNKPAIDRMRAELPDLWHAVVFKKGPGEVKMGPGDFLWDDLVGPGGEEFESAACAPAERAFIHYTELGMSGAVASHAAAFALLNSARLALDVHEGDRVCFLTMPGDAPFVPYAILAPLLAGATQVLIEDPAHFKGYSYLASSAPVQVWYSSFKGLDVILRNDPGLAELLCAARHIAVGPPTDAGFISMTSLSYGSPLHAVWWDREFAGIQLAEFRSGEIRPGSLGRPLPGVEIDVSSGRLALKLGRSCPFVEYWNDPAQTRIAVKNGWFGTSHKAKKDADGWIWPG